MTITVKHEIDIERVRCLLCSALEGGSNYWYTIEGYKTINPDEDLSNYSTEEWIFPYNIPFMEGCGIWITADDDDDVFEHNGETRFLVNLESMQRGLQIMAEKYPTHFANFISENDDAETADVWLQCSLFESIIFG